MPVIRILPHASLCPDGIAFEAPTGKSLLDALLAHGIALEHACEKSCACATCHVHIREGSASLSRARDDEEDELDNAWGVDADSRLACQVKVRAADLVIELPKHTRNLARERG
jgi:2Fe-2S ferredoxin